MTIRWDSFLAAGFIPYLRSAYNIGDAAVIAGISGGGYGALKLAFAHPHLCGRRGHAADARAWPKRI